MRLINAKSKHRVFTKFNLKYFLLCIRIDTVCAEYAGGSLQETSPNNPYAVRFSFLLMKKLSQTKSAIFCVKNVLVAIEEQTFSEFINNYYIIYNKM
jgi:hypothetical protein